MSWDVMVFDFGGSPPSSENAGPDLRPKSMGTPEEVRAKIAAHLEGIDWSDPTWGLYEGPGYSFEFIMGDKQHIDGFTLAVRGEGDAIAGLLQFAKPNGWSLFDCTTGEFIEPDNPSDAGWVGFQRYRDRFIGEEQES